MKFIRSICKFVLHVLLLLFVIFPTKEENFDCTDQVSNGTDMMMILGSDDTVIWGEMVRF